MSDIDALFRVDGLVAVISGGGTGIGLMMATALAKNGADKVYIVGRRLDKLQSAAETSPFKNIIPVQGDVTSKESLAGIAEKVKKESGHIDLLVCNSGTTGPIIEDLVENPTLGQVKDCMWAWDADKFTGTYALNNTATFFTAIAFLELLDAGNKKGRSGIHSSILITASLAGMVRSLATGVAYMTSKAAAVQMAKILATYLGDYGIRVNALAPGIFPSEMTQGHIGKTAGFSLKALPAGRTGTEEDMQGTVLYLASRAGAYINGMVILLDGGRLAMLPATY